MTSQPGVRIKKVLPGRFVLGGETFKANISFGLKIEIEFSYWEDGTYTIFSTALKVPGYQDVPLPLSLRDTLHKDENFQKLIKDMIEKGDV